MLTDDERIRIREEETFRSEVRAALEQPKTRTERLLAQLSTPFVLWFLSSVVLSGITIGYATLSDHLAQRSAREDQAQQVRVELQTRLERMSASLEGFRNGQIAWGAIFGTNGAYPEFRDQDFLSVAIIYRDIQRDDIAQRLVEEAMEMLKTEQMPNEQAANVMQNLISDAKQILLRGG